MTPFNFVSCLSAKENKGRAEEACHTLGQACVDMELLRLGNGVILRTPKQNTAWSPEDMFSAQAHSELQRMQIRTTLRYYFSLIRMAKVYKKITAHFW